MATRQQIAACVQSETGQSWFDICGRSRSGAPTYARNLFIALCKRMTNRSYPEIAEWINRRSHNSIMVAQEKAEFQHREVLDRLEEQLRAKYEDPDIRAVSEVLRRPKALRLMIERIRPLLAAEAT